MWRIRRTFYDDGSRIRRIIVDPACDVRIARVDSRPVTESATDLGQLKCEIADGSLGRDVPTAWGALQAV